MKNRGILFLILFVFFGTSFFSLEAQVGTTTGEESSRQPTAEERVQIRKEAAIQRRQEKEKQEQERELERIKKETAERLIEEGKAQSPIFQENRPIDYLKLDVPKQETKKPANFIVKKETNVFRAVSHPLLGEGWNLLFDGKTFFGWRVQKEGHYGGGKFTIENEAICSDPAHPGLLYTTAQFGDIVLEFEMQAEEGTEAFLLCRTSPNPKNLASSCYAILLSSASPARYPGSLIGRQEAAPVPSDIDINKGDGSERPWRKFFVIASDQVIKVSYDRMVENNYLDPKPLGRGYIGLLVTRGKARFRNMVWTTGSAETLFDGYDSRNWTTPEGSKTVSSVIASSLHLDGGPGMIESKGQYDNFVFRCEYRAMNEGTNSGVFFRSIPGENMNGYECQINDLPSEEDRKKYIGCDTGGIFRLQNARKVGARDKQWNSLTILAVDNHIETWVNGIPVADFFDRRPAEQAEEPNPRKGLRLQAGTIQLQGHDAGTQIDFRDITVSPIPPRGPTTRR